MAISKVMRAALKALSYPDIDIPRNYELERKVINATHPKRPDAFYKKWDHKVASYGNNPHDIPVRLYSPDGKNGHPIIIFFHGGGWVTGNIDTYDRLCCDLAKNTDRLVVSVDYSLAPENPFPAGLEDCYAVTKEIFSDLSLLKVNPSDITLMGDSAGGNLAAAVSLLARDRGEFEITSQVLIYPATYNDHTENSPYKSVQENGTDFLLTAKKITDYLSLYQSCDEDINSPYFAPLICKDLTNQPKTLIITAEFDPLRDEGKAYADALKEAGNVVKYRCIQDALHGFFSLPSSFRHVKRTYCSINRFLREVRENEKVAPEGQD